MKTPVADVEYPPPAGVTRFSIDGLVQNKCNSLHWDVNFLRKYYASTRRIAVRIRRNIIKFIASVNLFSIDKLVFAYFYPRKDNVHVKFFLETSNFTIAEYENTLSIERVIEIALLQNCARSDIRLLIPRVLVYEGLWEPNAELHEGVMLEEKAKSRYKLINGCWGAIMHNGRPLDPSMIQWENVPVSREQFLTSIASDHIFQAVVESKMTDTVIEFKVLELRPTADNISFIGYIVFELDETSDIHTYRSKLSAQLKPWITLTVSSASTSSQWHTLLLQLRIDTIPDAELSSALKDSDMLNQPKTAQVRSLLYDSCLNVFDVRCILFFETDAMILGSGKWHNYFVAIEHDAFNGTTEQSMFSQATSKWNATVHLLTSDKDTDEPYWYNSLYHPNQTMERETIFTGVIKFHELNKTLLRKSVRDNNKNLSNYELLSLIESSVTLGNYVFHIQDVHIIHREMQLELPQILVHLFVRLECRDQCKKSQMRRKFFIGLLRIMQTAGFRLSVISAVKRVNAYGKMLILDATVIEGNLEKQWDYHLLQKDTSVFRKLKKQCVNWVSSRFRFDGQRINRWNIRLGHFKPDEGLVRVRLYIRVVPSSGALQRNLDMLGNRLECSSQATCSPFGFRNVSISV